MLAGASVFVGPRTRTPSDRELARIEALSGYCEEGGLFGVVVDPYGLKLLKIQVICFEDAAAVEAFNVINAISPRQDFDSFVLANNGLHKRRYALF